MKLSTSILIGLLASVYGMNNSEFGGSLPYQHLMTDVQLFSYLELADHLAIEDLTAVIRMDLQADGKLDANGLPIEQPQQHRPVPVAQQQTSPSDFSSFGEGDYLADDVIPAELMNPNGYEDDFVVYEEDSPSNAVPQAGADERDADGNLYGPARNIIHRVRPMTDAEARINGLYIGPNPMSSNEALTAFLRQPQHLNRIMNYLGSGEDVRIASLLRIMGAAVRAGNVDVFTQISESFLVVSELEGSPELSQLILDVCAPGVNKAFLEAVLSPCTFGLTETVGAHLNFFNAPLHQTFVDKCGNYVSKTLGRQILPNVQAPEALQAYWNTPESTEACDIEVINPLLESSSDAIEQFADADVQIVCLLSRDGMSLSLPRLKALDTMKTRFATLSRSSGLQRKFACLHLDKRSNVLTILKSPQLDGPALVPLHQVGFGAGFVADELVNAALAKPFVASELQNAQLANGLRVATCQFLPGDIIVGLPATLAQTIDPITFVVDNFARAQHIQSSSQMISILMGLIPADFEARCEVILGVAPWTQGMIEQHDALNELNDIFCNAVSGVAEPESDLNDLLNSLDQLTVDALDANVLHIVSEDLDDDDEANFLAAMQLSNQTTSAALDDHLLNGPIAIANPHAYLLNELEEILVTAGPSAIVNHEEEDNHLFSELDEIIGAAGPSAIVNHEEEDDDLLAAIMMNTHRLQDEDVVAVDYDAQLAAALAFEDDVQLNRFGGDDDFDLSLLDSIQ